MDNNSIVAQHFGAPVYVCTFFAPSHRKPAFAAVISKFVEQPGIHETLAGVQKKSRAHTLFLHDAGFWQQLLDPTFWGDV